jgi:hypothetical protein
MSKIPLKKILHDIGMVEELKVKSVLELIQHHP